MKKEAWVVVANGVTARFFKIEKGRTLIEMEALVHPEGRLYDHDLCGDKGGNSCPNKVNMQHGIPQQTSPKEVEAMSFAKKICERIGRCTVQGQLEKLYIAAAPSFLGLLRQAMDHQTVLLIQAQVNKDITHLKPDQIREYFPIGI